MYADDVIDKEIECYLGIILVDILFSHSFVILFLYQDNSNLFFLFLTICIYCHFLANQPQGRRIGSINDYDPVNDNHGSQAGQGYRVTAQQPPQYVQQQQQTQQQKLQQYYQQQQRQHALHVQQQQQQQQALRHQQHTMSQQSSYAGSIGVSSGYHQAANAQPRSSGVSPIIKIGKF